jgi:hypothetical protein
MIDGWILPQAQAKTDFPSPTQRDMMAGMIINFPAKWR